jgi:hypothetical protein
MMKRLPLSTLAPLFTLLALPLALSGCGDDPIEEVEGDAETMLSTDGSSGADGGSSTDDSATEGSTTDGSTTTDTSSGMTDASTTDASTATDGGDTDDGGSTDDTGTTGGDDHCVEILGNCSHDPGTLDISTVLNQGDGLNAPTDCEFNPDQNNELWVTNREDYSMVVARNLGAGNEQTYKIQENFGGGVHFLAKPSALAFGQSGTLATAQQEDGWTQPQTPYDFMGPTLWGSSLQTFDGGHAGHLDMLHNSPNGSGLAWAGGNVYWYYDGYHGSLSRYDFVEDHGLGGTDHSDGIMYRALNGELGYEPGVASHVVYENATGYVYAADTANSQIVAVDPSTCTPHGQVSPDYDGGTQQYYNGVTKWVMVDGASITPALQKPSGMEMHDGMLFVTDYANGRISAFDMDGNLLDYLDTGFGNNRIMGITFGSDGSLYVVDNVQNAVYKISAN